MARGTLRIYLGAAAGVGKTFAMLNEGRRRRDYGEDVVVGFVETHGRQKTADQIGDLEVVPRRELRYRDSTFEEMDVDAVLARKPKVALVDELAHTNVPGSRNEKRWQDVEELLEAGINVISSMNVQHLESLNDVVEQITSVKQRETIPDEVVRRADEIQLVDLTPLALRNRLARGDVYPPERIDTALANYFRPGNLTALRELALAWLADRVDEALAEYRRGHGIDEPWETRERVLVALTGSADGERLVRRAARVAQRARGDLVGVHVIPQDGLAAPSAALLERQHELLEELGGTYHEVVGADIGEALLEAARSLNATQLVMGASRRSRWQRLTRGSVIGRVIRESGVGLDVHVVSHPEGRSEEAFAVPRTRRPATLPRRRVVLGFALAAVGLPLLTWVLSLLRDEIGLPSVMLLFLLLVVAVSAVGGPLACAGCGDRGLPARELVLRPAALHVHDRRGREHPRADGLPRGRADRQRLRRPRRAQSLRGAARPRRGRSAPAARRLVGRLGRARQPPSRARPRRSRGAPSARGRMAHRGRERRPRAREPAGGLVDGRARRGARARAGRSPDPQRRPARARRLRQGARRPPSSSASSRPEPRPPARSSRRTSSGPRSSRPCRTISERRSRPSRRR